MDAPIEGLTLNCAIDGEANWQGDVFCKNCNAIYLVVTVTPDESGIKKYVYSEATPKGMCVCGKRLFGGTDFTARPMCHGCAVRVTTRKAAERGEILWKQDLVDGEDRGDFANPRGDSSFNLEVWEQEGDEGWWQWAVHYPAGDCGGSCTTRELARKYAARVYALLTKLEEENK